MGTVVLKCGGSVADELGEGFFKSIKELIASGYQVVLVHGGGPDITSYLTEKGIALGSSTACATPTRQSFQRWKSCWRARPTGRS